jgi:hypothetical protein
MNTSQSNDNKLLITKETKQEEQKSFSSFDEAKQYLKTLGFSDTELKEVEQKQKTGEKEIVFNKTSKKVDLGVNNLTFSTQSTCSRCKKPIQSNEKYCRFCGAPVKIPLWKRILGLG